MGVDSQAGLSSAAHGVVAFTFATFLATVALLPAGSFGSVPGAAPVEGLPVVPEGTSDSHHHESSLQELMGAGPTLRDAAAIRDYCRTASPAGLPCIESALARLLHADGPAAAYALLDQMSAADADLLLQQHNVAHALGRVNYFVAGDVRTAISTCPDGMGSGCVHGGLETYFGTHQELDGDAIRGLCNEPQDDSGADFRVFNCLHGLGHGLDMYAGHDWYQALRLCDGLVGSWSRSACYGGVFMENIVGDQDDLRGGMPGGHHGTPAANMTFPRFRPEDPRYPCSVLSDQYLSSCYLLQTSMLFHFHPNDWKAGFDMCAGAPDRWQSTCYESMGRDISGATLRNEAQTLDRCAIGNGTTAQRHCLIGAVKDYINNAARLDPGISLCKRDDVMYPDACWNGVGQMAAALYPAQADREAACQPVPEDVRWNCLGTSPPSRPITTMTQNPYIVG